MFAPRLDTSEVDGHLDPIVKALFSPESDLSSEIPHLKYLDMLASDVLVEQIISKLRDDFHLEIISHGHK
jgi:hypothetical protein